MRNAKINKLIESGRICTVEFIKKDGSVGRVHGRVGVHKHTKGGERTSNPDQYIMFYDMSKGYRNVNRDTIIKVNGVDVD